jgi:hypothetical protein
MGDCPMVRVAALASVVGFKRLARRPQDRVDLGRAEGMAICPLNRFPVSIHSLGSGLLSLPNPDQPTAIEDNPLPYCGETTALQSRNTHSSTQCDGRAMPFEC